jgi:hypothetical protein
VVDITLGLLLGLVLCVTCYVLCVMCYVLRSLNPRVPCGKEEGPPPVFCVLVWSLLFPGGGSSSSSWGCMPFLYSGMLYLHPTTPPLLSNSLSQFIEKSTRGQVNSLRSLLVDIAICYTRYVTTFHFLVACFEFPVSNFRI